MLQDSTYKMSKIGKSIETESMVARGQEREEWEVTADKYSILGGDDKNVLELGSGDGCTGF